MTTQIIGLTRQAGVSMIETLFVFPIMILIGLGIVHLGLVYQAKSNLEYAALMAARVGAVNHANVQLMITEAVKRMLPSAIGNDVPTAAKFNLVILNPTAAMFKSSCAVTPLDPSICDLGGACALPNFGLQFRPTTPVCDGVSIQDANILRIQLTYNFNSHVPFMNMRLFTHDTGNRPDGSGAGVPITAVATVRMQSDAYYNSTNFAAYATN